MWDDNCSINKLRALYKGICKVKSSMIVHPSPPRSLSLPSNRWIPQATIKSTLRGNRRLDPASAGSRGRTALLTRVLPRNPLASGHWAWHTMRRLPRQGSFIQTDMHCRSRMSMRPQALSVLIPVRILMAKPGCEHAARRYSLWQFGIVD